MRIRLITTVFKPFEEAYKKFNRKLFEHMLPPLNLARLVRYEGQNPGDIVEIAFRIPFISNWTVIIKESWLSHREYGFVDRGLKVPFGIKYWKHTHRVVARDAASVFIIDDIEYETSWRWLDYFLYLPMWAMFWPRKFQYRSYYRKKLPS